MLYRNKAYNYTSLEDFLELSLLEDEHIISWQMRGIIDILV